MAMEYLPPFLIGALILVALWSQREHSRSRAEAREGQLLASAALFVAHADALARVLDSDTVPKLLKVALIDSSDAMVERERVVGLARLLAAATKPDPREHDQEMVEAIESLRREHPDASMDFVVAAVTGAFSAILKWPDSAVFFEQISAKMAADPRRDVDVVVATSSHRTAALPFGDRAAALA